MNDVIYLVVSDFVWADYHVDRAICWFESEPEATALARRMTSESAKWRSIAQEASAGEAYFKASEMARTEIGDEDWYPHREIRYVVRTVPKGTP